MTRSRREGQPRRWGVPPAIHHGPMETIGRIQVLAEHDDAGGVLLWRLVRDVELWSATPAEQRALLFRDGAPDARTARLRDSTIPTDVRLLVRSINRILAHPAGAAGSDDALATACSGVAQWAREIEAPETAVAFAQAAALSSEQARFALLTGECARQLQQDVRAVSWFSRAIGLARRGNDWRSYTAALLALGALAEDAGETSTARQRYLRALRTTRRHRAFVAERGCAAYRLFRLARAGGETESAAAYARIATRCAVRAEPAAASMAFALAAKRAWAHAWALAVASPPPTGSTDALLQLARCAAELGQAGAVADAGRAALIHASKQDYARVRAELLKLQGWAAACAPPMKGAA